MCLRGACPWTAGAEETVGPAVGEDQDANIKSHLMTPYYVLSRTMLGTLSQLIPRATL